MNLETNWRPSASRLAVEARAELLTTVRQFFQQRAVLEVETPVLSRAGNSDPNIHSISTSGSRTRYLRTSPEYALKRMLASGYGDIYELGRVFRAGESGRHHNPEFTLLEWYRVGWAYLDLADEVIDLIRVCGKGQFDPWPVRRVSYRKLFQTEIGLDPWQCSESDLACCASERGITAISLNHQEWLDLLLAEVIQPSLPGENFTVLHEVPADLAALARIRAGDPPVAERFEIYLGQMELANGYQELTDATEQLDRFEREQKHRALRDGEGIPVDTGLIAALRSGLPECSGVALGIDRFLMMLLKLDHMDSVVTFSSIRI